MGGGNLTLLSIFAPEFACLFFDFMCRNSCFSRLKRLVVSADIELRIKVAGEKTV